jgi:hypothetical protein
MKKSSKIPELIIIDDPISPDNADHNVREDKINELMQIISETMQKRRKTEIKS